MTFPERDTAEDLFAAWVEARERGAAPEFEALVVGHPEHGEALRVMHSDWRHFAPILDRVVPGAISGAEPGAGVAATSLGTEPVSPPSPELLERLGIQLPDAGRYRFRSVIGRGGGGVVLKVWDAKLQRTLAMKVVLGRGETRPSGDTPPVDAAVLTRFVDEARIASQLDHPGIVPVHELGTDASGRAFFTMRLVRGEDLGKVFERARRGEPEWTRERLLGVLVRVCEAVGYAHGKGVLHRDLKPANVMLGRHGEVHVMDWGLARTASASAAHVSGVQTVRAEERETSPDSPFLTTFGAAVGTPAYMAPEQARGELERVDARADVYAIGAMLYELLAGEAPFVPRGAALQPGLVLMRVVEGPPVPLEQTATNAPEELVAITERAMAREPERRYPDVRLLEADLRAYLEGRVVAAYESGTWAETRKWVRRNQALASALAALLLSLVIGIVVARRYARDEGARADEANESKLEVKKALVFAEERRRRAEESEEEAQRMLYRASIAAAAGANSLGDFRAARRFLAVAPEALRHIEWHLLNALSDTALVSYESLPGGRGPARFSSDGARVITGSGDARIWDRDTGECLQNLSGHCAGITHALFGPDDRRVATASLDGDVRLWDWDGASYGLRAVLGQPRETLVNVAFADRAAALLVWTAQRAEVWNTDSAELRNAYAFVPNSGVAVNVDGSLFACAGEDGTITVYDSFSGATIGSWRTELSGTPDLEFSLSGETLVASTDNTILLDPLTGVITHEFDGKKATHCLSDDASVLLVSHSYPREHRWRLIEVATGVERWSFDQQHPGPVWVSPNGSQVIMGGLFECPTVLSRERSAHALRGQNGWIDLVWSPDGKHVLTNSIDGNTRLWDVDRASGYTELRMPDADGWITAAGGADAPRIVCFSRQARRSGPPGASSSSVGTDEGRIRIWNGQTLELLAEASISIRSSHFQYADYSNDLNLCAIITSEEVIIIDPILGRRVSSIEISRARSASFRKGSCVLEVVDELLQVHEVDLIQGRLIGQAPTSMQSHADADGDEVASPDGILLARCKKSAFGVPSAIELYERSSRRLIHVMIGHDSSVGGLAFSSDGERLISFSADDGAVRIWDTSSGDELLRLLGSEFDVPGFAFLSSGYVSPEAHLLLARRGRFRVGCFSLVPERVRHQWRVTEQRLRPRAKQWIDRARERGLGWAKVVKDARADPSLGTDLRHAVLNEITRQACSEPSASDSSSEGR